MAKVSLKSIAKGLVALGTMAGGVILSLQAKKGLKADNDFEPTLEELGIEKDSETEMEPEEDQEQEETE